MSETHDQDTNRADQQPDRPTDQQTEDTGRKGNAEAAKYRRQLRDAEAERDTLRGRVEALQRAEAERLAAGEGVKASALWASGTELADLVDDEGNIVPDRVSEAASTAVNELGLRRERPGYVPAEGGVPNLAKLEPRPGFADAFTPPRR